MGRHLWARTSFFPVFFRQWPALRQPIHQGKKSVTARNHLALVRPQNRLTPPTQESYLAPVAPRDQLTIAPPGDHLATQAPRNRLVTEIPTNHKGTQASRHHLATRAPRDHTEAQAVLRHQPTPETHKDHQTAKTMGLHVIMTQQRKGPSETKRKTNNPVATKRRRH